MPFGRLLIVGQPQRIKEEKKMEAVFNSIVQKARKGEVEAGLHSCVLIRTKNFAFFKVLIKKYLRHSVGSKG